MTKPYATLKEAQCFCKSYYDDNNQLRDCTCEKCEVKPTQTNTTQNKEELEAKFDKWVQDESIPFLSHDYPELRGKAILFVSQAHQSGIEEERKRNLLDLAEAQFLGFHHGRWNRDDIAGLVFSMGLTKEEWKQLNKKFSMSYLTKEDRKEIEEALKENKQ